MKVRNLFLSKTKDVSEMVPENSKNIQSISKIECELCGGNHEADQCSHERRFSLGMDTTSPDRKDRLPNIKSRSVDYSKPTMEMAHNMEASPNWSMEE